MAFLLQRLIGKDDDALKATILTLQICGVDSLSFLHLFEISLLFLIVHPTFTSLMINNNIVQFITMIIQRLFDTKYLHGGGKGYIIKIKI